MDPSVTIIIVTWNALPLLQRCFPSVAATDYSNLEIVVADNASSDGTAEWLRQAYPSVRVIRHPRNWLFARGNNEAIRQTGGTYVVLLNNDVEVPPNWLQPLIRELEALPDVAAVQPKLLQHERREVFEYAGACGGFIDYLGYPFARGRIFETLEPDVGQYDDARDVFWASGAAMVLRRDALNQVGLLDERFEMHMEEIDLCWRLHRHGYRVRVVPESAAYHIGGGSLAKGSPQKTYYNFRNSLLMLYKNLPPRLWRRVLPQRAALDAAAAARAAASSPASQRASGDGVADLRAIARAYRDAHRLKDAYDSERPGMDEVLPPHVFAGSIAAAYYLLGRRTFSALPQERFSASNEVLSRQAPPR